VQTVTILTPANFSPLWLDPIIFPKKVCSKHGLVYTTLFLSFAGANLNIESL
jgi:hypothetical protein